jgi:hypothetical protein
LGIFRLVHRDLLADIILRNWKIQCFVWVLIQVQLTVK